MDNDNRTKLNEQTPSSPVVAHKTETKIVEHTREIQPLQASNDNQWNDWSTNSPQTSSELTDHQEPTVANRLFGFFKNVTSPWSEEPSTNDWEDQNSPIQLLSDESSVQQTISSPSSIKNSQIQQIISEYPDLFPNSNGETLHDLDQIVSIIKFLRNQLNELQK